ncbi:hypothetical protein PGTUg99_019039 [Puccinia graminis f. sp. tritici]|uniref:Uncharacterized protein n=1 Tax=Puccinia graminis f. sp. tritici TaxID=56615 RepID=A0A5B0R6L9_PUCGR|nr:hypothetical protein PGTUg99_019039 [Puccinia graminis f. sp. tritici]
MSHPITGDSEWDALQGDYDPHGFSPLSGQFSNPAASAQQPFSGTSPGDPCLGQTYQSAAASNPPAIPPRPTSHTSPVQNIGVRRMVPSTSPYRTHHPPTEACNLPANDDLLGAALSQTELLTAIQSSLQAIQSSFRITEDLLQQAQPLLQMSQEARTTAILLLALQNNLSPQPTIPNQNESGPAESQPDVPPARSKAHMYNHSFRAYLRTNIRLVLLDKDLECYSHRNAQRVQASVTPVTRIMMHLPKNVDKNDLERFIADQVKNKRSYFAKQLKVGVGADSEPIAVPSLWTVIANVHAAMDPLFKRLTAEKIHSDKRISRGTKIRILYLRFMINMHCQLR